MSGFGFCAGGFLGVLGLRWKGVFLTLAADQVGHRRVWGFRARFMGFGPKVQSLKLSGFSFGSKSWGSDISET